MKRPALAAAVIGSLATAYGYFTVGGSQFFQSYLMGFLFVLALSCGSLGFLLIHHVVDARWGHLLQRPLEAATRVFPLLVVLFVPVVLGMQDLYRWARPEAALEEVLVKKAAYLNVTGFYLRAVVYFAVWLVLAYLLSAYSKRQDEHADDAGAMEIRMRKVSGIGLPLLALTVTFAAFDWVMSLEPAWYSSIYGALILMGQGVSALCFMAIMAHLLRETAPLAPVAQPRQFQDIGNLLFTFIILWAYMSISQFVVIWTGNLPEEVEYYLHRAVPSWKLVAVLLTLLHFVVPFLLLLFQRNKQRSGVLAGIALLVLILRPLDLQWLVTPVFRHSFHPHWLDAATLVGLTGLWLVAFLRQLGARPLLPVHDKRFDVEHGAAQGHG